MWERMYSYRGQEHITRRGSISTKNSTAAAKFMASLYATYPITRTSSGMGDGSYLHFVGLDEEVDNVIESADYCET